MKKEELIKFFMSLGATKEQAETLTKNTSNDGDSVDGTEILDGIVKHQRSLFENDVTYKKSIQDSEMAKQRDIFEAKIKKIAGLTAEETKDKKLDDIVALAFERASKSKDATADDLQIKLRAALDENKRLTDEEIPNIKNQVEVEKKEFKKVALLNKELSTIKIRQGVDAEDALILAKAKAEKLGYKIELDEKGDLTILTGQGAKITTSDGRTYLSSKEILSNLLDGFVEKSNGDDDKKKAAVVIDDNKKEKQNGRQTVVQQNLENARAHAESLKK
jgi:hypothetical protein